MVASTGHSLLNQMIFQIPFSIVLYTCLPLRMKNIMKQFYFVSGI
jgi:hypothetical protein